MFWNNTGAPIVSAPYTRFLGVNPSQGAMGGAYLVSAVSTTASYSALWSNSSNSAAVNIVAFRYDPNYIPTSTNTWSGWWLFYQ